MVAGADTKRDEMCCEFERRSSPNNVMSVAMFEQCVLKHKTSEADIKQAWLVQKRLENQSTQQRRRSLSRTPAGAHRPTVTDGDVMALEKQLWLDQKKRESQEAQVRRKRIEEDQAEKPIVKEEDALALEKRLWLERRRRENEASLQRRRRLGVEDEGRTPNPEMHDIDRLIKQRWLEQTHHTWEAARIRRQAIAADYRAPLPTHRAECGDDDEDQRREEEEAEEASALQVLEDVLQGSTHQKLQWLQENPVIITIERI